MQQPSFTLSVRDLERTDQRRSWELPPAWLDWALAESEARSTGLAGKLEVYAKKNGREVLVKGHASARVVMPCARTLDPVEVALEAPISLLLSPRPAAPPQARAKAAPAGRRRRGPHPASDAVATSAEDEHLSAEEAGRDTYDGETVALDGFVREHLLLELPLFPLRSDLPLDPPPATDTPPDEPGATVDPRLAPLAALASQFKTDKE